MRSRQMIVGGCLLLAAHFSALAATATSPEDTARFQSVGLTAKLLLNNMRDPDSTVFEIILSNEDASVVCITYRSRNGFGGMNREAIIVTGTKAYTSTTAWKKHCSKATINMTYMGDIVKKLP